ncbi:unnamed protein product, partial [Mesorhabditis belari]|uniref:Potassium channel domain-containing protein n=1 Tax=Mesorhabditis belari TaxID=2138241 RepID=A0AAF3EC17_9BILA
MERLVKEEKDRVKSGAATVQNIVPLHRPPSPIPEELDDEASSFEGSHAPQDPQQDIETTDTDEGDQDVEMMEKEKNVKDKERVKAPSEQVKGVKVEEETSIEVHDNVKKSSILQLGPRHSFARQVSFEGSDGRRKVSENENDDESRTPSIPGSAVTTIHKLPVQNEREADDRAIDRYYENNHYTVTGMYTKNTDTMNRIPNNYQKIIRDMRNREHSIGKQSTLSNRSKVLPIAGSNENRFANSFYWLAHHHKNIGLRHFFMFSLVVLYSLLGGALFNYTETPFEHQQVADYVAALDERLNTLATEVYDGIQENQTAFSDIDGIKQFLKDSYIQLLKDEGRYEQSAFQKAGDPGKMLWNFWSATFYSTNIFMTVGYGVIAPITDLGRFLTVIYGIIFVPFSSIVCRDLGQWMLVGLTKLYARVLIRWRKARGVDTKEDEDIAFPMKFAILTVFAYWFFCALLTWLYDDIMGDEPGTGMSYWASVYFSFITLTAIGLGDLMPNNVPRSPLMKIWYFLGLPVFKVVNRMSYVSLENGVFGTLTVLENKLDMWNRKDKVGAKCPPKLERGISQGISYGQTTATGLSDLESTSPTPSRHLRRAGSIRSRATVEEQEALNEALNNFTIRSIGQFMQSRADVYAGDFGRVKVTKAQLKGVDPNEQA